MFYALLPCDVYGLRGSIICIIFALFYVNVNVNAVQKLTLLWVDGINICMQVEANEYIMDP